MNKPYEIMDKSYEAINKPYEIIDKPYEIANKPFEILINHTTSLMNYVKSLTNHTKSSINHMKSLTNHTKADVFKTGSRTQIKNVFRSNVIIYNVNVIIGSQCLSGVVSVTSDHVFAAMGSALLDIRGFRISMDIYRHP